jgi:prepilin-type processing-associated H-X9-DG protein
LPSDQDRVNEALNNFCRETLSLGEGEAPHFSLTQFIRDLTLRDVMKWGGALAILAVILIPIFFLLLTQRSLRRSSCIGNQQKVAMEIIMYAQDNGDLLPSATTIWDDVKVPKEYLVCPTRGDLANGYGYNRYLAGLTIAEAGNPMLRLLTADSANGSNVLLKLSDIDCRHSKGFIASYLDGHVAFSPELFGVHPNPPAVEGLKVWLGADYGAGADKWLDESDNKNNAVQPKGQYRPKYIASAINSLPALAFTGASFMTIPYQVTNNSFSYFVVYMPTELSTNTLLQGAAGMRWLVLGNNQVYSAFDLLPPISTNACAIVPNKVYVSSGISGEGGLRGWTNGMPNQGTSIALPGTSETLWIGGQPQGKFGFKGYISEILLYRRALNDTERATVEQYLMIKYGLMAAPVADPNNATAPGTIPAQEPTAASAINTSTPAAPVAPSTTPAVPAAPRTTR